MSVGQVERQLILLFDTFVHQIIPRLSHCVTSEAKKAHKTVSLEFLIEIRTWTHFGRTVSTPSWSNTGTGL